MTLITIDSAELESLVKKWRILADDKDTFALARKVFAACADELEAILSKPEGVAGFVMVPDDEMFELFASHFGASLEPYPSGLNNPSGARYKYQHANDLYRSFCYMRESMLPAAPRHQEKDYFDVKRFEEAPCYLCGYNGRGYYQPTEHPCASRYHAVLALNGRGGDE